MEPINYVDRLNEKYQSLGFEPYQWTINDSAPLTPLAKPLSACCVSMLTTSGASCKGLPGFDPYSGRAARRRFRGQRQLLRPQQCRGRHQLPVSAAAAA